MKNANVTASTAVLLLVSSVAAIRTPYGSNHAPLLRKPPPPPRDVLADVTINSPEELARTLESDIAILFIDVDWSLTSKESGRVVSKLRDVLKENAQLRHVMIRRVDCTEQKGPVWDALKQWFEKNDPEWRQLHGIANGGAGSLIYVRSGKAVGIARYPAGDTLASLIAKTREVME